MISTLVKPDRASLPKPVPVNAPNMRTIIRTSPPDQSTVLSPAASDWKAIQLVVDSSADYAERLKAVGSLSGRLTEVDLEMLQSFLLKPDSLDHSQMGQALKNQILDELCALNPPPAGLGDVLTKMFRDSKQDDVIRDYAVQHMAAYYEQLATQPNSERARQAVQKILWEAVNEPVGSVGGTALLALKRLSQEYTAGIDQKKIGATALQMAGNPIVGELSHITALQVCAQLGNMEALPVALKAANNGESIVVKMSAIGALGLLGGPDQISYLNSVLSGPEDRLKPVAKHALMQISARQNQMAKQKRTLSNP